LERCNHPEMLIIFSKRKEINTGKQLKFKTLQMKINQNKLNFHLMINNKFKTIKIMIYNLLKLIKVKTFIN